MNEEQLREIILNIPKTEIHLHIEALASAESIWKLINKNKLHFDGINSLEDLKKSFGVTNLTDFINLFIKVIQGSFKEEDDFKYLIEDTKNYMKRNNVFYAELFFAPTAFVKAGFDIDKILSILDQGAKELALNHNLKVKFIIDVSRGFGLDNALNNLNIVLRNNKESIIGIGLGGAEKVGKAEDFLPVFTKAKENGLRVVAHAGEDVGPESIWAAVDILHAERIGHGISAKLDENLMLHLKELNLPLEVCPTSNFITRTFATDYKTHPVKLYYDKGLNVTINTDDPTIFGVEIVDEYLRLIQNNVFTLNEIIELIKNNLFATFLSKEEKITLWESISKKIDSLM